MIASILRGLEALPAVLTYLRMPWECLFSWNIKRENPLFLNGRVNKWAWLAWGYMTLFILYYIDILLVIN